MKPRHKFNAKITIRDGHKFSSKKEAEFYDMLVLAKQGGHVLFWNRQPRFDLPGGVKIYADFLVFYADGRAVYYDVKGKRTPQYIRNKKQVEALFPVEIVER